jgi:hypothetical protein
MLNSAQGGARGVDGSLLFTVPYVNKLNQIEPGDFFFLFSLSLGILIFSS